MERVPDVHEGCYVSSVLLEAFGGHIWFELDDDIKSVYRREYSE